MMSQKGANSTYWRAIREAWASCLVGLMLTWKHFRRVITKNRRKPTNVQDAYYFKQDNGLETLSYPHEKLPIPDNGRYKLHNEIEDCIVCDKCAKVCPVDCIEIEPIKSTEVFGYTSDGTGKRIYAAKFNIDMAKCCFCGLCTTVCPTECLTMTKEYDFSEFDIRKMDIPFAVMTEEEINEKKIAYQTAQKAKADAQLNQKHVVSSSQTQANESLTEEVKPKTSFKPKVKPIPSTQQNTLESSQPISSTPAPEQPSIEGETVKKPTFRPKVKPITAKKEEENSSSLTPELTLLSQIEPTITDETSVEKPKFRPKVKPIIKKNDGEDLSSD